jgi:hypothetical protein
MTLQEQLRQLYQGGPGVTHIASETLFEEAAKRIDELEQRPLRIRSGTHTYALLEVTAPTYQEIKLSLILAGYDGAINNDGEIDMHGIALVEKVKCDNCVYSVGNPNVCDICGMVRA